MYMTKVLYSSACLVASVAGCMMHPRVQGRLTQPATAVSLCWVHADDSELLVEPAGRLLRVLWQQQPSLMDDFVSDNHLEPLLERMVASRRLEHAMIMVKLVQDIWSSTTALQAESQLVEALPGLIQACKGLDEGQTRTAAGYPLTEHIKHIYLEHQVYFRFLAFDA